MKKVLVSFIAIISMFLVGCSLEPIYYSKEEVIEYVELIFGEEFEIINQYEYPDDTDEENSIYEYEFANSDGVVFSVLTYTYHTSFDASVTSFYDKAINNDYNLAMIELNKEEIQDVLDGASFEYEFDEQRISFDLEQYTMLSELSEVLVKIDQILELEYDYSNWSDYGYDIDYSIPISLKPNNPYYESEDEENWQESYSYRINEVRLSNSVENRLKSNEIFETLERELVYKIRRASSNEPYQYILPETVIYQYPAEYLLLVTEQPIMLNNDIVTISFYYDPETKQYWTSKLDPCQDFEEGYNYSDSGTFGALVEYLGGTYLCDDWKAEWSLGKNCWKAELSVDEDSYYQDFTVWKNGEKLNLDDSKDKGNGTVSGRAFTKKDIGKMLGIAFEENQIEELIYIKK